MTRRLTGMDTRPPNNCRSFDNCMLVIEVAGMRILHWGDNRPDPPDSVWDKLGDIDIALLPIDGSQHVLSYASAEMVAARLKAKLIVPHHYHIWDVTTRGSTLLPPDEWVNGRSNSEWTNAGSILLTKAEVKIKSGQALCFGEHVGFDKSAGRKKQTCA